MLDWGSMGEAQHLICELKIDHSLFVVRWPGLFCKAGGMPMELSPLLA